MEIRVNQTVEEFTQMMKLADQCDSKNERLRYELTNLEERLRDLDIAGREFDAKVEDLEELLPAPELDTSPTGIMTKLYNFFGF